MPVITSTDVSLRKASILSIKDLIEHATLIESIPNKKTDKKPNVETYHRFYVPVLFNGRLQTIRLVAETQKGDTSFDPLKVNLYDIITEKKSRPAKGVSPESDYPMIAANGSSYTISIRDMLRGVKNSNFKNYYQNGNDMMTEKKSRSAKGFALESGYPVTAANGSSSKPRISNESSVVTAMNHKLMNKIRAAFVAH